MALCPLAAAVLVEDLPDGFLAVEAVISDRRRVKDTWFEFERWVEKSKVRSRLGPTFITVTCMRTDVESLHLFLPSDGEVCGCEIFDRRSEEVSGTAVATLGRRGGKMRSSHGKPQARMFCRQFRQEHR